MKRPVFFICLLSVAVSATVFFSETFESDTSLARWSVFSSKNPGIGVTRGGAYASEGAAGIRMVPDIAFMLMKQVMWDVNSPQLNRGFYLCFHFRLNRDSAQAGRDKSYYSEIARFVFDHEGPEFSNPTFVAENAGDGGFSPVLILRQRKGDDPLQIIDRAAGGFTLSSWHTAAIYCRVEGNILEDSLFIDEKLIGFGMRTLDMRPRALRSIFLGCGSPSTMNIGSMDLDNVSCSSTRAGMAVQKMEIASRHTVFHYGDTLAVRFDFTPPQDLSYIDLAFTAGALPGDEADRYGMFDPSGNLVFSMGFDNGFFYKFREGSGPSVWKAAYRDTIEAAYPFGQIDFSSYSSDMKNGTAVFPLVLGPAMKTGPWTVRAYLYNTKTLERRMFPEVSFELHRSQGSFKGKYAIVPVLTLAIVCGILMYRKKRNKGKVYPEPWQRLVNEVDAFLGQNYADQNLDADTIAQKVNFSRQRLLQIYKDVTGKSPVERLREMRIEKAAVLLKTTNKSVFEISVDTGFADPKVFARNFKSVFGKNPVDYRTH